MSLSINRRVLHLPSGCHLGHYKVTLECLRNNNTTLPEIGIYTYYPNCNNHFEFPYYSMEESLTNDAGERQSEIHRKFNHSTFVRLILILSYMFSGDIA